MLSLQNTAFVGVAGAVGVSEHCQNTSVQFLFMYSGGAYGTKLGIKFESGNAVIGETVTSAKITLKRIGGQGGFGDISCYLDDTVLGVTDAAEITTDAAGEVITFDSAGASHTVEADDVLYVESTHNDSGQNIQMAFTGTGTNPNSNESGVGGTGTPPSTDLNKQPKYCVVY